jgi:DNA-binding transcriptional LysR family regulator
MDLRQLAYVVAVVDHGGFTAAADELHVAQPSLSQSVRSLERELGVDLFHRTGRAVVLTAAGEALLGPARQALRDAAIARAAVADVAGLTAGRLDLVCLPTLAVFPVAGLVGRFRQAHPGVAVRLAEPEDANAVAHGVRTGRSEIGFTELPLALPGLQTHELEQHDFVAVLPRADAVRAGRSTRLSIKALAALPLITTPIGTSTRRQIDDAFAAAGLQPEIAIETDHREVIIALVEAGAGVAIVPRPTASGPLGRTTVVRDITPRITRRVGVVHRPGTMSPAASAFLELCVGGSTG